MNASTCPECGATMKPGATLCPACLLSAGAATLPMQPVSTGITTLPCVFGGYRLLKKLGTGGMGIVYEAEEIANGRRIALKVLNQSLDTEEQRQRFLREGRLAATIDHPHSVYVFGTDEIDGIPVIAMELATGGTLRDELKRRGTMPVRDAVDAILGIIDGLEAAHAKGVLHRDMKPSNCFVTGDGKAIVGDYGLSISQTNNPADGGQLTRSGMIMGTPAFSPPEQLRGLTLDQRADIYSTAGTLYYLLTGRAPVERHSSVETVAAVLEGAIPDVRTLREDVPDNLAAVVARSLSANPAKRPATYAELRMELLPFSSVAKEPAPLGLRVIAHLLDSLFIMTAFTGIYYIVALIGGPVYEAWSQAEAPTNRVDYIQLSIALISIVFFSVMQTRWGATPGMKLCQQQLQRPGGERSSWRQTLLREVIFGLPGIGVLFILGWLDLAAWAEGRNIVIALPFLALVMLLGQPQLLLFIPAWRHRERAAWHDQISGLRVVQQGLPAQRLSASDTLPPCPAVPQEAWEPFQAGTELSRDFRCGYDPVLRRPVVLQRRVGAGPSSQRRDGNRPGRLRWLQSVKDTEGQLWDAWQAPAGAPLSALLQKAAPSWSNVLCWLDDLAQELDAAQKDGTMPDELSLDRVWITSNGLAILLDHPWPGAPTNGFTTREPQKLLHHLATQIADSQRPVHADALVDGLRLGSFERISHVSGNLKHLRQKKTSVDQAKRIACTTMPILLACLGMLTVYLLAAITHERAWLDRFPGIPPLPDVFRLHLQLQEASDTQAPLIASVRQHLAGHYHSHFVNGELTDMPDDVLAIAMKDVLIPILREENVPDSSTLAAADRAVKAAVEAMPKRGLFADFNLSKTIAVISLSLLALTALAQLFCILATGAPLLMSLTGIAAVSASHRPASRLRMLGRWSIGWLPLWSPVLVMLLRFLVTGHDPIRKLPEVCMIWVPAILVLMLLALMIPRRSLVDRLAGTWLVAR